MQQDLRKALNNDGDVARTKRTINNDGLAMQRELNRHETERKHDGQLRRTMRKLMKFRVIEKLNI